MNRAQRIEQVVSGVVRQAFADAGATRVTVSGAGADGRLLATWCERAFGSAAVGADGLKLHPASKTALLLGAAPAADVLPFGDLYYSQVVELAGGAALDEAATEIARQCCGT